MIIMIEYDFLESYRSKRELSLTLRGLLDFYSSFFTFHSKVSLFLPIPQIRFDRHIHLFP